MAFGITATGFVVRTQEDLDEQIKASLRSALGASLPLHSKSVMGQWATIIAVLFAELWEVAEDAAASQDPDSATGAALDGLAALTGTIRKSATNSTVTLTLSGTNTTSVPAGNRARTASTKKEFVTQDDVILTNLVAWAGTTVYVVGNRRSNAGRSYVVITAGTSAGAGGPTTTAADITDNTVHWRYIGEGTAVADVAALSADTGPVTGVSGDITELASAVGGWSSVINLLDADLGQNIETDGELRERRALELSQAGNGTPDAIRASLLEVEGVTAVTVFYNDTDIVDVFGVPPHSVEILVRGGADQDIWDAVFANVAAGIGTHGTEDGTATDSQGTAHDVSFSRPSELLIWITADVRYNPAAFPVDGAAQIKEAIVAYGDAQETGVDAVASRIASLAFTVVGVTDVTNVKADIVDPPVSVRVVAGTRFLCVYDTSRIALNLIVDTP
jgi:uncharacterized phage protein gp47/JayE